MRLIKVVTNMMKVRPVGVRPKNVRVCMCMHVCFYMYVCEYVYIFVFVRVYVCLSVCMRMTAVQICWRMKDEREMLRRKGVDKMIRI